MRFFLCILGRFILFLRYRIEVEGLESLINKKGICFLPNHPSAIDPVILMVILERKFKPRPVVVDTMYKIPFIHSLMKLVRPIVIPNFDEGGNEYTKLLAKRALKNIQEVVNKGENILLYPSGKLKRSSREELKAASGAFDVVKGSPGARFVLVRTEGLWGSIFSYARNESSSQILQTLLKSALIIIQNLIFFAPRRRVKVTFSQAPPLFYSYNSKDEFNRALENWYNTPQDLLSLVRESFWSWKKPEPLDVKILPEKEERPLSEEVKKKVIHEIAHIAKRKSAEIALKDSLSLDLGMDSLDIITLISYIEDEFAVTKIGPGDLETVFDAIYIASYKTENRADQKISTQGFVSIDERKPPFLVNGKTLVEVFLKNCDRRGVEPACADLISGQIFSYDESKKIVVILSRYFKKLPEKKIAVMMPATSRAYFVIMALMLAGKTPVMVNWAMGSSSLKEVVGIVGIKHIITSRKFVHGVKIIDLEGVDHLLLFLEDIDISLIDKIGGAFIARKSAEALMRKAPPQTEESHAVILFTSGSESAPKAVPLTHKNILSNLRASLDIVPFNKEDVLLGFLPPFHSFGFGITGLGPLLSGLLVVFSPDPTDSFRLAESIMPWHVTFLCGAPTFLRGLINTIGKGKGEGVRLIVTGAEKAPAILRKEAQEKTPNAKLVEGYGITECGPILTLNLPGEESRGVGRAIPHVELAICNREKTKLLPQGQEGIILAKGPGIFKGYLAHLNKRPFITLVEKKWYVTGDLGYLDEQGFLWLSGRLKRFVKMGGEMVNLLMLEQTLLSVLQDSEALCLSIIALEEENKRPELILFTTKKISIEEVNRILRDKKIGYLAKISRIVPLVEMPLLGTGKINIPFLENYVKNLA